MTTPLALTRLRAVAAKTYTQTIVDDAPVGFWSCGDAFGNTTLVDSSGNARTLTLNGTTKLGMKSRNARTGQGISWTGASGYASIAAAAWHQLTADMTAEGWLHFPAQPTSGNRYILIAVTLTGETLATNTLVWFAYRNNGGTLQLWANHESGAGVDTDVTFNVTLTPNAWHHLVLVRDATAKTYDFWVDGVLVSSQSYATNPAGGTTSQLLLNAGSGPTPSPETCQGDGYALYSAKLSAARIGEHWRAGRRASGTAWENTALLLRFEGADASTTTPDASSFGHAITFNAAAQIDTAQFKFGASSCLFAGGATNDRLTIPSSAALTLGTADFTIEGFFRTTTIAPAFQFLYDQRTATASSVRPTLYIATDTLVFFQNGAARITSASVVAINTWYHVALQRVSGVTRLFLNGVQVGSDYADANSYLANQVTLGNAGHAPTSPAALNGWLDAVRVTNGTARYNHAGFTAPTAEYNYYE